MTNNIIGHIVGLDEIHKKKIIENLPINIKIIDLDIIQQKVYNNEEITKKKILWEQLSKNISIKKNQKKLIGLKKIKPNNIDKDIRLLLQRRNIIKHDIHMLWKEKVLRAVEKQINNIANNHIDHHILLIGSSIFPKDYRIRANIVFPGISVKMKYGNFINKIILDVNSNIYASNQIEYYLNKYSNMIIHGKFPLKLLDVKYLEPKYDKFINFYEKQGYKFAPKDKIIDIVKKIDSQFLLFKNISNKNIYVATLFRSGDIIPVNSKMPIEGFLSKDEAINNIKNKLKKNAPVYVYKLKPDQFELINGKLYASQSLYPINEESILLTN